MHIQPRPPNPSQPPNNNHTKRARPPSTSTSTSANANAPRPSPRPSPPPPHHLLHPSTPVAIILKQDQPSGRRVTGLIADILTRGSHPRGVKVRLRDSRVGRVQAIVSLDEGVAGEEKAEAAAAAAGGGVSAAGSAGSAGRGRGRGRGRGCGSVGTRYAGGDEYLYDEGKGGEVCLGLFAALEDADRGEGGQDGRRGRRRRRKGGREARQEANVEGDMVLEENTPARGTSAVARCPVCDEFEGDEPAVAHHVERHFAVEMSKGGVGGTYID